jgi:hypothetical protein
MRYLLDTKAAAEYRGNLPLLSVTGKIDVREFANLEAA